ncbi:uncharacterized protein [Nicotiana tomentosiformis]|uniref:uncharacterized protein n=1 Tax=Nicotiana tomentosiformis TaxID=4098 RepID=UPI00388CA971
MEFSRQFIRTEKTSGNGGRSLFFGVCSLLHLLVIPIHIMYLGQGRRLTGFTQGGCKGGKTMCSHLKSFARLGATLTKQRPFLRLSSRERRRNERLWRVRLVFRDFK